MQTKIFINYRHIDCKPLADYLHEVFKTRLPDGSWFLDNGSIAYGKSITEEINTHMEQAKILLVLIGPNWLEVKDEYGDRRLTNPKDWVRREIEMAREQNKLIIPVSYQNKRMKDVFSYLDKKITSLSFLKDLKQFYVDEENMSQEVPQLLGYISRKAEIELRQDGHWPEVNAEGLRKEIDQHFPLSKAYAVPTSPSPFKGLNYFTKEDATLFFGRDLEILSLCRAVNNYPLVLLFGQSGVGKSSLLNAGVLPRMEMNHTIFNLRRDHSAGYHRQIDDLPIRDEPSLIILDQVEEVYTNPRPDKTEELSGFFSRLSEHMDQFPKATFLLGFRSEWYPQIKDLLEQQQRLLTREQEHFIKPLNKKGIWNAVEGIAKDKHLSNKYKLEVEPGLPEAMSFDLLKGNQPDSHIGPLLQYQLRLLWDRACDQRNNKHDPVLLSCEQYQQTRKNNLAALLDDQLALFKKDWADYLDQGLILELLYAYVSPELTASHQLDEEILARYAHVPGFSAFFHQLKNHSRLLIPFELQAKPACRLAHDTFGPLISERYLESDAIAQRAWRIIETKKREIDLEEEVAFSDKDIEIILEGEPFMQAIPSYIEARIKADQKRYERQRQERFDNFFLGAEEDIEHLNYQRALERLRLAFQEKIHLDQVYQLATQLPWILAKLRQTDLFEASLGLLSQLSPEEKTHFDLLISIKDQPSKLSQALKAAEWNEQMRQKYFPTLKLVSGGSYKMGSEEGHSDEKPVHQVKLSDFFIAETPVTCWQFGLFCKLTGKDLPMDSGFGRADRPVINVNWFEAVAYCNWLTEYLSPLEGEILEKVYTINGEEVRADWSKNGFRLLTEAEWEYAAREKGKKIRFGNGQNIADPEAMNFDAEHPYNARYAPGWYKEGKSRKKTTPVQQFPPNALGLYDMSGNVWEWCWDEWSEGTYYKESKGQQDPTGPETGENRRVVRGGAWFNFADVCRCSFRNRDDTMNRSRYCWVSGRSALALD